MLFRSAFALIIRAGIDGINKELELPKAVNENMYFVSDKMSEELELLPQSLGEALQLAKQSPFIQSVINPEALQNYIEVKEKEIMAYQNSEDKSSFYYKNYFSKF